VPTHRESIDSSDEATSLSFSLARAVTFSMFFRSRYLRARPYQSVLINGTRVPDAARLDSRRGVDERIIPRHARERASRKPTSVGRIIVSRSCYRGDYECGDDVKLRSLRPFLFRPYFPMQPPARRRSLDLSQVDKAAWETARAAYARVRADSRFPARRRRKRAS